MKRVFYILSIVFIFLVNVESKELQYAHMGYLTDGMNDIKYKDARIAFRMWLDDLSKENDISVELIYYDFEEEMVKDFTSSKLDYIALNPIFYLKNREQIDTWAQEFWTVSQDSHELESHVVLVRNDSGITSLKDLKGKTIATRSDNYMGYMFLDAEILKDAGKETPPILGDSIETKKFSTALLKTFFKKADACIVPKYTLDIVSEMNPAVLHNLKILKQSEEIFFPIIAIFHKKADKELVSGFKKSVYELERSVRGKHIFSLFKMKGLDIIKKEDMLPIVEYYEKYIELKRKHVE